MRGLILETSTNQAGILLVEGGLPISVCSLSGGVGLSQKLEAAILNLLSSDQKIDFVAVGIGPGSYTGVRVGAAMAQSLAYGWNVPLSSFCSLKAFHPFDENCLCAVLFDARSRGFYCLRSDEEQARLLSVEEARTLSIPLFSPQPDLIQQRLDLPVFPAEINASYLAKVCQNGGRSALLSLPFGYIRKYNGRY